MSRLVATRPFPLRLWEGRDSIGESWTSSDILGSGSNSSEDSSARTLNRPELAFGGLRFLDFFVSVSCGLATLDSPQAIVIKSNKPSSQLSRPSHNLSGNGRAATSRDTGMTNRDLGASRGSDERLKARRARRSHLSHKVTCELTWSCESQRRK